MVLVSGVFLCQEDIMKLLKDIEDLFTHVLFTLIKNDF